MVKRKVQYDINKQISKCVFIYIYAPMQARTSVAVVVKAGCKSESPRFSTLCVFFFSHHSSSLIILLSNLCFT